MGLGGVVVAPGSGRGAPMSAVMFCADGPGSVGPVVTVSEMATSTVSCAVAVSLPKPAVTVTGPPTRPVVVKVPVLSMLPWA